MRLLWNDHRGFHHRRWAEYVFVFIARHPYGGWTVLSVTTDNVKYMVDIVAMVNHLIHLFKIPTLGHLQLGLPLYRLRVHVAWTYPAAFRQSRKATYFIRITMRIK